MFMSEWRIYIVKMPMKNTSVIILYIQETVPVGLFAGVAGAASRGTFGQLIATFS